MPAIGVKTSKKPVWCDVADCCIFESQCIKKRERGGERRKRGGERGERERGKGGGEREEEGERLTTAPHRS